MPVRTQKRFLRATCCALCALDIIVVAAVPARHLQQQQQQPGIRRGYHECSGRPCTDWSSVCSVRREQGGDLRVAQRAAQPGDTLVVDFKVVDPASGDVMYDMARERLEIDTTAPEGFLPGIVRQMMGLKVGERVTLDYQFPSEWAPNPELQNAHAKVHLPVVHAHQKHAAMFTLLAQWTRMRLTGICMTQHRARMRLDELRTNVPWSHVLRAGRFENSRSFAMDTQALYFGNGAQGT